MTAEVFVDTNIFLYSINEDPASQEKRQRSQHLLLTESWGWSVQVAAESFVNATSPKRPFRLSGPDAAALLETWFAYPTVQLTSELVRASVELHQRYQLNYWDAAILTAAKQMGCRTVYSEDLSAGQDYNGVTVISPFAASAAP
jgi:predicted nucleic acid-binding protein